MRIFLAFALCASSWAQETPSELKLPENFLRFDISKLRSAVSTMPTSQTTTVFTTPKPETCGHIRVLPANPDMDPGITLPSGTYVHSRMPVLKGMPACETHQR